MNKSVLLNMVVIAVIIAFAAIVAVPADETILSYGHPRDPDVLMRLIEEARADFDFIDVRTAAEFRSGHIPTATNIDHREIESAMAAGDTSRPVVVYCQSGNRSAQAVAVLNELGYTQVYDFGAVHRWPESLVR
jgi:phage shock protein E